MKCWICGADADSGEHMIKKSDLQMRFDTPTQSKPLYYNSDSSRNIPIGSFDNWRLKHEVKICTYCNNTRSQPYDRAWERMSANLMRRFPCQQVGSRIRGNRIFPYNTRRKMADVHLFFVKLFGCLIHSSGIPIDIHEFSTSLLNRKIHQNVYLRIGVDRLHEKFKGALRSPVLCKEDKEGKTIVASWYYQIGHVVVNTMYVRDGWSCEGLDDAWHPRNRNNFQVADCFYALEGN